MGFYTPGAELLVLPIAGLIVAAVSFLAFWVFWSVRFRRRRKMSIPGALGLALLPALGLALLIGVAVMPLLYWAWFT